MSQALVKKLATKTIVGTLPKKIDAKQTLYRIVGICRKVELKETTYGDSYKFSGDFKATNMETGEIFRSSVAFLPGAAEMALVNAMANAADAGSDNVQFGFDVSIKPSDAPTGYEYEIVPLVEMGENDPLAALESSMPALGKPKADK